jgi:ABC-type multidrug transport system fused ATPase/permease subunit
MALGLLDIFAVMLFGLIGSLTVSNLSSQQIGNTTAKVIDILSLEEFKLQTQVAVLGSIVAVLLLCKSYITLAISQRIVKFLSFKSAATSVKLLQFNFSQDLTLARNFTNQKTIFALTHGVQTIIVNVVGGFVFLITDLSLLILFGIGLILVDISVAITTILLFSFAGVLLGRRINNASMKLGEESSTAGIISNQLIERMIFCYRELVIRNEQKELATRIANLRYDIARAGAKLSFMGNFSKYILEITLIIGGLAVAAVQFYLNSATEAITVISVFLMSSTRIVPAVLRAQTGIAQIKASLGAARPTLELVKRINAQSSSDTSSIGKSESVKNWEMDYIGFDAKVEFERVFFNYPENEKSVLSDINLSIRKGEFLAVAGPSGAGKSTLLDLMLGLNKPTTGKVFISERIPRDAFLQWPGAVAYVPQEVFIFDGTFKENICLTKNQNLVSDDDVESILISLGLEDLLQQRGGIHSNIGDRGVNLSGGQRQRIGIARALITKPKLIVFDEATSSLDSESEELVVQYVDNLRNEATLIVVAHRLSTIKQADRIIYIEDGKITAEGSWKDLSKALPEIFK